MPRIVPNAIPPTVTLKLPEISHNAFTEKIVNAWESDPKDIMRAVEAADAWGTNATGLRGEKLISVRVALQTIVVSAAKRRLGPMALCQELSTTIEEHRQKT